MTLSTIAYLPAFGSVVPLGDIYGGIARISVDAPQAFDVNGFALRVRVEAKVWDLSGRDGFSRTWDLDPGVVYCSERVRLYLVGGSACNVLLETFAPPLREDRGPTSPFSAAGTLWTAHTARLTQIATVGAILPVPPLAAGLTAPGGATLTLNDSGSGPPLVVGLALAPGQRLQVASLFNVTVTAGSGAPAVPLVWDYDL